MDMETEFVDLHSCPIDWEQVTNQHWGTSVLQFDWQHALQKNAVRPEDIELDLETDDSWRGNPDLPIIVQTLRRVREDAKKMYATRAGRLGGLQFLTPSEHGNGKHFVPNLSEAQILERTRNGRPSLFFRNYRRDDLGSAFWQWFLYFFEEIASLGDYEEMIQPGTTPYNGLRGQQWHQFISEPKLRVCFENSQSVGASEGELTPFLCFEIHFANKTVHSYPVTQQQALDIMGRGGIVFVHALSS